MEIRILRDEFPEDPRDWANVGTMVLSHRKYAVPFECEKDGISRADVSVMPRAVDVKALLNRTVKDIICVMPVYGYDHSGIWMSTQIEPEWVHFAWDGGLFGFIYATRRSMQEILGRKRLTPKALELVKDALKAEVQTYSKYMSGDVYYVQVVDSNGEQVDALGSVYNVEEVVAELKEAYGVE